MHNNGRKFSVEKKGERRPFQPKKWNHQDDLTALKGQTVTVVGTDGSRSDLVVLEADQFTIKFRVPNDKSELICFKHAIAGLMKPGAE